jgi:DNA-directed RNA polymerase sigma subunit (sigma70/sigma32)
VRRLPPQTDRELVDLGRTLRRALAAERLAGGAVAGGEAARKRLIEGSLAVVVAVAEEYRGQGLSLGELLNAGNVGLVRAVQRDDWRQAGRFRPGRRGDPRGDRGGHRRPWRSGSSRPVA